MFGRIVQPQTVLSLTTVVTNVALVLLLDSAIVLDVVAQSVLVFEPLMAPVTLYGI